ncbi:MAG: ATP-binding protein [Deltaproteobacteria bacterium]|nr:ATP-binding protein [Deltaproteobacteria bacterium]
MRLSMTRNRTGEPEAAQALGESVRMLDQIIRDTRTLTFDLSPPILYELGFVPAVEWLIDKAHQQHGLACESNIDCAGVEFREDLSVLLFRIIREIIINTTKHAKASRLAVDVYEKNGVLFIRIEDNGRGFDTSRLGDYRGGDTGFGLFNVRERLEHLGGGYMWIRGWARERRFHCPCRLRDEHQQFPVRQWT